MPVNDYVKKPIVIQAIQLSEENAKEIEEWAGGDKLGYQLVSLEPGSKIFVSVYTLEGDMRADPGDWIIKGIKGEFYPCKNDIFEATYESVEKGI